MSQVDELFKKFNKEYKSEIFTKGIALISVSSLGLFVKMFVNDAVPSTWRNVFIIPIILAFAIGIAAIYLVRETPVYTQKRLEYLRSSEEEREAKDNDDLIYRTLYKSSKKNKDRIKEKEEKYKKNKEKEKENLLKNQIANNNKNLRNSANNHNNFNIEIEQGDNLHYNNEDKKIYLNVYNNKSRSHKKTI